MIPEGWERTTIGAHVDVLTGYAFKSSDYSSGPDDIRLLRGDNVAQHRIRWRDAQKLPQEKARGLDRFALRLGDFVIALDRTWIPAGVKIAEITEADLPSLLVQRVARLRSKPSLEQSLMRQFFSGHGFEQYVKSVQTETAVPHISPNDLRNLAILLPPLPEQKRMAETLETWDRAIETVEALIANARAQKQALMQQLLTGKRRLTGFDAPWRERSLESVFQFKKGQGLSKEAVTPDGVRPCILYGELYTRYPEVIREVVGRTNANDGFPSMAGDVLIPASTTTTGIDLANATAILESDVLLSGDINILRPKDAKQSAPFFAYLLTHNLKHKIASRAQGITIVHLYGAHLKPLTVFVPEAQEQHAIASIIMEADNEILGLEAQLTALRQEKAALMQQLLTGKRRVKLPESEAA